MLLRLFTCLALLLTLGVSVSAAETKPYPLTTCIVSGDKLDPAVPAIVHNGQQIKFCCKSCVKKFQANPDKYLIKLPKK
jgi:YHS domain-containing protein